MRRVMSMIHGGLAWVILAAVVAQFFFAGLGIFRATSFGLHRTVGTLTIPASLILLLLALAGGLGRMRIGMSALLFVLTIVQMLLPSGPPVIAALHPVNALMILGIAATLARQGTTIDARAQSVGSASNVRESRLRGERTV